MRKPDSLRKLLVAAVPHLAANPDALAIFVDRGRVAGGGGATLSYEHRYALNIVVEDYAGDLDLLFVPILAWLAEHQPELLDRPGAEPFAFEAEILDGSASDVSITIEPLTEGVIVTAGEDGGYTVAAATQVPRHDFDRFPGVPCGTTLWQLFLRDELIAEGTPPASP